MGFITLAMEKCRNVSGGKWRNFNTIRDLLYSKSAKSRVNDFLIVNVRSRVNNFLIVNVRLRDNTISIFQENTLLALRYVSDYIRTLRLTHGVKYTWTL